ncbi:Uncharacterised protein [Mycobacteroides abscessus subsp. abscessus]|uniref:hypothetical protein n=4 Tax=Mycobacteroides abscessus TaxID=36809 RepID=UPI00092BE243|nr:hypothetical protein [Mycobacteroides abscessus]SIC95820.1 Uncharacterised protein [Mycobacteroides abscessus subsp. abscessus]SKV12959.1 Uncharacterised protein [Mycobacteroides abscessus subsp. abscessus]SKW05588.1 Uncharacterised protein [Mycobacteroides abscessus subsp. abscessus]
MSARAYGARYDSALSLTDIAAKIRTDIRAAIKAGKLPGSPVRYSVRAENHIAVEIRVQDWPQAWTDCTGTVPGTNNLCRWAHCAAAGNSAHGQQHQVLTAQARTVEETLKAIHRQYNFDGSDMQADVSDVNYYGGVEIESASDIAFRAEEKQRHIARKQAVADALDAGSVRRVAIDNRTRSVVHLLAETETGPKLVCGARLWRYSLPRTTQAELSCSRCRRHA